MKALLLLLACSFTVAAQKESLKPCTLTIEQSPEVRGFKLGQAYSALTGSIGGDDFRTLNSDQNEIGLRRVYVSNYLERSEPLKGIDRITLSYLDNSLASFEIGYNADVKWDSDTHFAAAIADQLYLPTPDWTRKYSGPILVCDGFTVQATVLLWPVFKIEKSGLAEEIRRREAALDQKRRGAFKP